MAWWTTQNLGIFCHTKLILHKAFLRLLIDYWDLSLCLSEFYISLSLKISEWVQHVEILVTAGAMHGAFYEHFFPLEFGLEALHYWGWFKRLCCMLKTMKSYGWFQIILNYWFILDVSLRNSEESISIVLKVYFNLLFAQERTIFLTFLTPKGWSYQPVHDYA